MSTIFGYVNTIDNATLTAPTSEDSSFPVTNLQIDSPTYSYRTVSGVNDGYIVANLGSPKAIDMFMIIGDKLDNPLSDLVTAVSIEYSTDGNTWTIQDTVSTIYDNLAWKTFVSVTKQYWRFGLIGSGLYTGCSNIFLGSQVTLGSRNDINLDWSISQIDKTVVQEGLYGQKYFDIRTEQRVFDASISYLNQTELTIWNTMTTICKTYTPVWLILTEDVNILYDPSIVNGMYYFTELSSLTNTSYGLYNTAFSLTEVI